MGTPTPVSPPGVDFDGTNHDQVLQFLRDQSPSNPIVRGGVVLNPAPGDLAFIHVQYEDGSTLKVTAGDVVSTDPTAVIGVQSATAVTTPPITPPTT